MPSRGHHPKDTQSIVKTISKQVNIYIRRHPFVLASTESFTTSQRRAFLRDVYDYSRSSGLTRPEAKRQIIKARQICGEDDYLSDESAMENEIDDSELILEHVQEYKANGLPRHDAVHERKATTVSFGNKSAASDDGDVKIAAQKRKRNGDGHDASTRSAEPDHSSMAPTAIMSRSFNRPNSLPLTDADHETIEMPFNRKQKSSMLKQVEPIALNDRDQDAPFRQITPQAQARPANSVVVGKQQKFDDRTSHPSRSNSSQTPATAPSVKTSKKDQQNFDLPEVAMFTDDED